MVSIQQVGGAGNEFLLQGDTGVVIVAAPPKITDLAEVYYLYLMEGTFAFNDV